MYLIKEKTSGKVLYMDPHQKEANLDARDLYPEFDPRTMQAGWSEAEELPYYYEIDEKGMIRELTLQEQAERGFVELLPSEKIVGDEIVPKSLGEQAAEGLIPIEEPFEYVDGDDIAVRSLEEILDQNLLKTRRQCERALIRQGREIEAQLEEKYRPGYELKLTKDYIEWLEEGKPQNDERYRKYKEMQDYVKKVKEEYRPRRERVKELMKNLSE